MQHCPQCSTTAAVIRTALDDIRSLIQVISALTPTAFQIPVGAPAPGMNKTFYDLPIHRALPKSSIYVYPLTPTTLVTHFFYVVIPRPLHHQRSGLVPPATLRLYLVEVMYHRPLVLFFFSG
jgi:hypothetical protein